MSGDQQQQQHQLTRCSASPGRGMSVSGGMPSPVGSINVVSTSPSVSHAPPVQPLLPSRLSASAITAEQRSISASSLSASTSQQAYTSGSPLSAPILPRPTTASEMELYQVLSRANLLPYFSTFVAQGGDDVQQLMEAGDEEFLEIMALVGMASKPLHVRRLQKALHDTKVESTAAAAAAASSTARTQRLIQEISASPQQRLLMMLQQHSSAQAALPFSASSLLASAVSTSSINPLSVPVSAGSITSPTESVLPFGAYTSVHPPLQLPLSPSTSSLWPMNSSNVGCTANLVAGALLSNMGVVTSNNESTANTSGFSLDYESNPCASYDMMPLLAASTISSSCIVSTAASSTTTTTTSVPPPWTCAATNSMGCPTLTDAQITKITQCAISIAVTLPQYEPKLVQNKKKISSDLLHVMKLEQFHGDRLPLFRKYAAIYGRFDAKRKADKPLTLHEVSVNEAAAQICLWRSALLTRRDELFPLARQCVKDAGYHYVKGAKRPLSDVEGILDSMGAKQKRATPTNSVGSSGGEGEERSQTPSSCAPDTPPPTMAIRRTLSDPRFHQQIETHTSNSVPSELQQSVNVSATSLASASAINPLMFLVDRPWTLVKHEPTSPPVAVSTSLPPTPSTTTITNWPAN